MKCECRHEENEHDPDTGFCSIVMFNLIETDPDTWVRGEPYRCPCTEYVSETP